MFGTELSPDNWRVKLDKRTRDRMKVTFKLNQDETAAYERFKSNTQPEGVGEEDYIRSIFFLGLATLEQRLMEGVQAELQKQAEEQGAELPPIDPKEVLDQIVDTEASE